MSVPTRCEIQIREVGKIRAIVDVHYGDFVIRGFKVMKSNDDSGHWVAMPSKRIPTRDGDEAKWVTTVWIDEPERLKAFERFVLENYQKALETEAA